MRIQRRLCGAVAGFWSGAVVAIGRADEALTPVLAQVTTTKSGKNYVVEAIITVVLIGLAVWAICKTSHRV